MITPPMLGPTMRAELKHAELSEIALPTSARPTISATNDWRAGPSNTLASPTPVASTATCQYSTCPPYTSAPSTSAWAPITDWVTSNSRRLGTRSATAPDTIEKRRIGPNWSVPMRPRSSGDEVSWSTSQDCATVCIQEPTWATNCAEKNRRKSACRNARMPVGGAIHGRSAAGHALGIDEDRVERLARGEEEPVALGPAEAEVGAALRQQDAADELGVRIVDRDTVESLPPAPAPPEVAVGVAAQAVRDAGPVVVEDPAVGEPGSARDNLNTRHLTSHSARIYTVVPIISLRVVY